MSMKPLVFLTTFFMTKRLASGAALLLTVLCMLLLLSGFLAAVERTEGFASAYERSSGGNPVSLPVQTLDKGSVHTQVWKATDYAYLHSYPIIGGTLLPLRLTARWLFIILPFVGMLLSACEVSGELETGVAQTLYGAPVPRSALGISRVIGDSVAVTALISLGIALGLAIGGLLVEYEIGTAHVTRSAVFILVLGFYTSIFVQLGSLISAVSRRSASALWVCIMVGLAIIGIYVSSDNLLSAAHAQYSSFQRPPMVVNRFLSSPQGMSNPSMTDEEVADIGGPELARYMMNLAAHQDALHGLIQADYQRERWVALISPVHAIWEVAQQLLQDRHNFSAELFAPIAAMDPPPSIRRSLAAAWPELAGLVVAWLVLFAINVRVLSKLEV
ncbi:ABC transporter permease [Candidatus Bipolaricaulota bacterium]|nr:ABC transporter permease [Candidatus Bipolaricaulota bacterium]